MNGLSFFLQTCFIDSDSLFEAFDVFLEEPSLEYKMWLSVAIGVATNVLMKTIDYQVLFITLHFIRNTPLCFIHWPLY